MPEFRVCTRWNVDGTVTRITVVEASTMEEAEQLVRADPFAFDWAEEDVDVDFPECVEVSSVRPVLPPPARRPFETEELNASFYAALAVHPQEPLDAPPGDTLLGEDGRW